MNHGGPDFRRDFWHLSLAAAAREPLAIEDVTRS